MSHLPESAARPWDVDAADVAAQLATDPARGFSAPEAAARLLRSGRNGSSLVVTEDELMEGGRSGHIALDTAANDAPAPAAPPTCVNSRRAPACSRT